MKHLIIFIALIGIHSFTNARSDYKNSLIDTTYIFNWEEGGVEYQFKISLIGVAGRDGVIPGQGTESYIHIEKKIITPVKEIKILEFRDTCNAQVSQLVFYFDHLVQRVLKDKSREFYFFYEFGSDGLDPRQVKYIVVGKTQVFSSKIDLSYDERKMKYVVNTPLLMFLNHLPKKYRTCAHEDYNSMLKTFQL